MKTKKLMDSTPQFLYCPWRIDSTLTVFRHLIVTKGPKRIAVQSDPCEQQGKQFHCTQPLVYVERNRIEGQGHVRQWIDPEFSTDPSCPLGKFYDNEHEARLQLILWVYRLGELVKTHPASLNLPLAEDVLLVREAYHRELRSRLRSALSPVESTLGPLSPQKTSIPQEVQRPLLRYTYRNGPFDGQVEEHPGDPDLEDPYFVYEIRRLRGKSGKQLAHLYDRTDEYTATGFRIYHYGGVVHYKIGQDKLRLF